MINKNYLTIIMFAVASIVAPDIQDLMDQGIFSVISTFLEPVESGFCSNASRHMCIATEQITAEQTAVCRVQNVIEEQRLAIETICIENEDPVFIQKLVHQIANQHLDTTGILLIVAGLASIKAPNAHDIMTKDIFSVVSKYLDGKTSIACSQASKDILLETCKIAEIQLAEEIYQRYSLRHEANIRARRIQNTNPELVSIIRNRIEIEHFINTGAPIQEEVLVQLVNEEIERTMGRIEPIQTGLALIEQIRNMRFQSIHNLSVARASRFQSGSQVNLPLLSTLWKSLQACCFRS